MIGKDQQQSFGKTFKRALSIFGIVLLLFAYAPEEVESRRSFGGSRSFGRSFSRSSSRSYSRSSKTYSAPKRTYSSSRTSSSSRSTYTKPRTSTPTRSTGSSYTGSRTSKSTSTRTSTTARQKQTATNRAKTTNTPSTRNSKATGSQQRATTAQNRKQVRQLKAENRSLKRKVTTANRQTASARRQQRQTITVNNYRTFYNPYSTYSLYSYQRAVLFDNLMFGLYFHDYYNHAIRRSYLWHYHHPNYDRQHWTDDKQKEYEFYKEYYENQGIEPNENYVDPGTNRDEDYIASYVEENPDKFYGDNVEVVTVEELPDEEVIKQELLATAETPTEMTNTQRAPPQQQPITQKVVVEKKTSGGTWFILIFGSLLIVGGIMLVLYNKGYF
ncbi:MAG: hypothetical protein OXD54_12570 [Candidatus Poribacteria bacterium]|nr:hypothetical protein [Candidatus Poribacteria bacterium]